MRFGGDANLGSPLSAVGVLTNRMYISRDKPGKKIMT